MGLYIYSTIWAKNPNVISKFINKKGVFDFNEIIAVPKELEQSVFGGGINLALTYFLTERLTKDIDEIETDDTVFKEEYEKSVQLLKRDTLRSKEDWDALYERGQAYLKNKELYGFYTWNGWCREHWGTKYNAECLCFRQAEGDSEVSITTEDGAPIPVFRKICELFPSENIKFTCDYDNGLLEVYVNRKGRLVLVDSKVRGYTNDAEYFESFAR